MVQAEVSSKAKTVLLVDGAGNVRLAIKWFLESLGYVVEAAHSAEEALALLNPKIHDIVITNNRMSGMSGSEMAHIVKLRSPATPVLMHTGELPEERSCLDGVLQQPTHLLLLKDAIDEILAEKR